MPSQHSSTGHKRIRKKEKEKKPGRPKPPAATAATAGVIDLADDDDDMPPLKYVDSDGDGEGEDQFLSQFDDVFADYLGLGTGGAGGGSGLEPLLGLEPLADGPGIMDAFTGLAADGLSLKAGGSVVAKTGGQGDRIMRTHLATAKALVSPKHKRKQLT
jgi:hypothetical protein